MNAWIIIWWIPWFLHTGNRRWILMLDYFTMSTVNSWAELVIFRRFVIVIIIIIMLTIRKEFLFLFLLIIYMSLIDYWNVIEDSCNPVILCLFIVILMLSISWEIGHCSQCCGLSIMKYTQSLSRVLWLFVFISLSFACISHKIIIG